MAIAQLRRQLEQPLLAAGNQGDAVAAVCQPAGDLGPDA
jgi:hypothetical protein